MVVDIADVAKAVSSIESSKNGDGKPQALKGEEITRSPSDAPSQETNGSGCVESLPSPTHKTVTNGIPPWGNLEEADEQADGPVAVTVRGPDGKPSPDGSVEGGVIFSARRTVLHSSMDGKEYSSMEGRETLMARWRGLYSRRPLHVLLACVAVLHLNPHFYLQLHHFPTPSIPRLLFFFSHLPSSTESSRHSSFDVPVPRMSSRLIFLCVHAAELRHRAERGLGFPQLHRPGEDG